MKDTYSYQAMVTNLNNIQMLETSKYVKAFIVFNLTFVNSESVFTYHQLQQKGNYPGYIFLMVDFYVFQIQSSLKLIHHSI